MDYNKKLKDFIKLNGLEAQHLEFKGSCHTVEEAAKTVNVSVDKIVKNICMIDKEDRLIIAIVTGEDRVSTTKVGKVLNVERPRLASEDEVLDRTGYPAGGVPSFGYKAIFLIDSKLTDLVEIYTGGGYYNSLTKMNVKELLEVNKGQVVRIRK